ncbi:MAG: HAD-IA family hydrolase [Burkholderiales bacterium]|nr:HAD-IA family hydrolase [Burkholderiales bacterium]
MLDIARIKAITLDLDDTLWPIWPTIHRAEQTLAAWLAERAPGAAAVFADPLARKDVRAHVEQTRPDIAHDLSALRRESIRAALHRAQEDTSLAEPAFEVFFAERMRVELFEDALPALAALAARFPIVAVSNGNAHVGRVGLGQFFVGAVSASEYGVAKPDARIFHAAASQAGVASANVLHVGDDAALDVLGALGAGMQTVWVNRAQHVWSHAEQPHHTVQYLAELVALLA